MIELLTTLGGRLSQRWLTTLLAPGLLFVAAVAVAARLGHAHALAIQRLRDDIVAVADHPAGRSSAVVLLVTAAVLVAAATAGLVAASLGGAVERMWLLPGRRQPLRSVRAWRLRRWRAADAGVVALVAGVRLDEHADTVVIPGLAEALARRDAICLVEPERPTWIADRLRALGERIHLTYGLDLTAAWPRVWSLAPADLRTDVIAAHEAYSAAARLAGWSLLYAVLAAWWWPSSVVAAVLFGAAWMRARSATGGLAELVESTVDLHGRELAARLGVECGGPLTVEVGEEVTVRLRKDQGIGGRG
ncbi:hypothetical protein [Phytohabitans houttuyneae]|uniref:Uncharacterized protein n=1 Tax=Phytohabitans houttuyneae TaxID=1076126 RepID=A0A6V8K7M9_9ACTN|nr:hypothetical protein [Phytohabitans houttuyneae]GFJ81212.1 hypothetical protein Phou_053920 [Phytohabitans houttuyneae]